MKSFFQRHRIAAFSATHRTHECRKESAVSSHTAPCPGSQQEWVPLAAPLLRPIRHPTWRRCTLVTNLSSKNTKNNQVRNNMVLLDTVDQSYSVVHIYFVIRFIVLQWHLESGIYEAVQCSNPVRLSEHAERSCSHSKEYTSLYVIFFLQGERSLQSVLLKCYAISLQGGTCCDKLGVRYCARHSNRCTS